MEIREAQTLADYAGILAIDEVDWNDTNAPVAMQKWPDAGEFQAAMVAEGRRHGVAVDENDAVLGYVEFSSRFQVISISGTLALVLRRLPKVRVLVVDC